MTRRWRRRPSAATNQYTFDLAGNRTQQIVTLSGTPTTTNYSYNAANQMTAVGAQALTYDNNGNMLNDAERNSEFVK